MFGHGYERTPCAAAVGRPAGNDIDFIRQVVEFLYTFVGNEDNCAVGVLCQSRDTVEFRAVVARRHYQ